MKSKKMIRSIVMSLCLILPAAAAVFAGEQEQTPAVSFLQVYTGYTYEHEWSAEARCDLVESRCPVVALDEETSASYPELAEAFNGLNDVKFEDFHKTFQENVDEITQRIHDDPNYTGTYTDRETCKVVRADQCIVSLLGTRYGYTGGAHGYEVYSGMNYDPVSGKELKLSEFVTDPDAFRETVKEQIYADYPYVEEDLTEQYFAETNLDDMIWTAGYEGITCYFNAYTLGPYAIGSQIIHVPYAGNETLMTETFTDVPQDFCMEFMEGHPVKAGGREIIVNGKQTEQGDYDGISISLDGEQTDFETAIRTFSISPAYVKTDGNEYLYIQYEAGNDYSMFEVFRLGEKPEQAGTAELGKARMDFDENPVQPEAAMTDPKHLLFAEKYWLLDIFKITRLYHVGADGMPEAEEPYFEVPGGRSYTAKAAFTCTEVNEEGSETGSIDIPAGEKLAILRTDNCSMLELGLEDGRIVHVDVEVSEEDHTRRIDGKNLSEVLAFNP